MLLGFDAVVKLRAASASDGVFGSEDSLEYRTEQTCSGKCHDKVDPDHPKPRVVRDIQCHLTAFPTDLSGTCSRCIFDLFVALVSVVVALNAAVRVRRDGVGRDR